MKKIIPITTEKTILEPKERKVFVTSDWHLGHNRDFCWQARGFNSVEEMNCELIKRHNEIVTAEDDVYILGDLTMGTDHLANKNLIEQFNGHLHIVFGNHDSQNKIAMYHSCKNVVEICGYATMLKYRKYHFYLSHYPALTDNYDDGESLKTKVINLCGHSHVINSFADWNKGTIFHCEVDSNNCYPWNLDDIIKELKNKSL
mgnify:CR=1 FL=1